MTLQERMDKLLAGDLAVAKSAVEFGRFTEDNIVVLKRNKQLACTLAASCVDPIKVAYICELAGAVESGYMMALAASLGQSEAGQHYANMGGIAQSPGGPSGVGLPAPWSGEAWWRCAALVTHYDKESHVLQISREEQGRDRHPNLAP